MQVVKPMLLGLLTRPIEHRKRFGLCVSAVLHFPFVEGEAAEPTLWTELSLWPFLTREMPDGPLIDEGIAKLTPEFLVHGYAFAPKDAHGERASGCAVRARLGTVEKTVLASGERAWVGDRPTKAGPCDRIPLSWAQAYGGPDHALNPLGKGRTMETTQGAGSLRRLPNLEYPDARCVTPDAVVRPAAFGRIDPMWPQRAQYRGTYDDAWYKAHAPGFAPDMDWRHFNLAPSDQWLSQPLRGDESFLLENMHPDRPCIESRLPGFVARCFAQYRAGPDRTPVLREVPLRLTTVWFFPHAQRGALVFQGLAEVDEDDGSDVAGLMGAVERIGEAKDDGHYAEAWERRQNPVNGGLYALRESDLLPAGLSSVDPDFEASKESLAVQGLQGEAQRRRAELIVDEARAEARAQGLDPDALNIRMPQREPALSLERLPDYVEEQNAQARRAQLQALNQAAAQILEAEEQAERDGIDLAALVHRGPPSYSAAAHIEELTQQFAQADGTLDAKQARQLEGSTPKLFQLEAVQRANYLATAHAQPAAFAMPTERALQLRDEMSRAHRKAMSFAGLDLTGANLAGLDLHGADFSHAWLESADFTDANISGARFNGAVLAHANLQRAMAIETDFTDANLGCVRLEGAVLDRANLSGAILMNTRMDKVHLRGARLVGTQFLGSLWGEVDATDVDATAQTFVKLDFRQTCWAGARLDSVNFVECQLEAADLSQARLHNATFVHCAAARVKLPGAQLVSAAFVEATDLSEADLRGACCDKANLGATTLQGARCEGASFKGANLRLADLRSADLRRATANGCLLTRARLDGANAQGINLMGAVLQNANLRGTDLRGSNLHGADMSRVRLDGSTRFGDGLLTRARTYPRLTVEQQTRLGGETGAPT